MSTTELGTLVRARRTELGLTQERLAEQVGRSQRWVSHIESGKAVGAMRTDLLYRLADALRVDPDALAVAAGIVRTRKAAAARRMLADMSQPDRVRLAEMHGQLDRHLLRLSPTQFEHVLQTARMWAEAADIRSQAADPVPPHTSPQSPPAGPAPASPPIEAPESAESGCGR